MISLLKGVIENIGSKSITLMVSGLGLEVFVPFPSQFEKGKEATIFITLNWNQDHGPSLYGFATQTEKKLFELVVSCSGIGPKIALSVLRDLTPDQCIEAIEKEDASIFNKVSGIGKKKAEHMIVVLKHKMSPELEVVADSEISSFTKSWKDVSSALSSLNYMSSEIQAARAYVQKQNLERDSFDVLMRCALSFLSKKV